MEKRKGRNIYTEKEQIEKRDIYKDKTYSRRGYSKREDI